MELHKVMQELQAVINLEVKIKMENENVPIIYNADRKDVLDF